MFLFRSSAAMLALAVLTVTAAGQDKVDLKWKFQKGKTFYQRAILDTDQTLTFMGKDIPTKNKQTILTSWTPVDQLEDKSWVIKQTILAMKMDMEAGGMKISYDSEDPNAGNKQVADALQPLIGAEFKATISPQMKTTKVEGLKDLLDKLGGADPKVKQMMQMIFTEDTLKEMSDSLFSVVPPRPVAVGDSWSVDTKVPLGALGNIAVQRKFIYEGQSNGLDKIKMDVKFGKHEPADPKAGGMELPFRLKKLDLKKTSATGTLLFNADKGRLESTDQVVKLEGNMVVEVQGMEYTFDLKQTQTVSMKTLDTNPLKKK